MKLINEKLDYSKPHSLRSVVLFTGNSYINKKGELVMGRGAALDVKKQFPDLPKKFGDCITVAGKEYGVILITQFPLHTMGVFQVKYHYKDNADILLIKNSTEKLKKYALKAPNLIFHMNFPGIGWGGLTEKQVMPIIESLPDNVWIYK